MTRRARNPRPCLPARAFPAVLLALSLLAGGAAARAATPTSAPALTERQKIDRLLAALARSNVIFIREGSDYDGKRAAQHLRDKLDFAGDRIKTLEEFIEQLGSRSSLTGRAYQIKLPDGTTVESGGWLRELARKLDAPAPAATPAATKLPATPAPTGCINATVTGIGTAMLGPPPLAIFDAAGRPAGKITEWTPVLKSLGVYERHFVVDALPPGTYTVIATDGPLKDSATVAVEAGKTVEARLTLNATQAPPATKPPTPVAPPASPQPFASRKPTKPPPRATPLPLGAIGLPGARATPAASVPPTLPPPEGFKFAPSSRRQTVKLSWTDVRPEQEPYLPGAFDPENRAVVEFPPGATEAAVLLPVKGDRLPLRLLLRNAPGGAQEIAGYALDLNGDGRFGGAGEAFTLEQVRAGRAAVAVKLRYGAGEQPSEEPYAFRLLPLGEDPRRLLVRRAGARVGSFGGLTLCLYDENANGRYDEPLRDGLSAGRSRLGLPLGRVMTLGGRLYAVETDRAGTELALREVVPEATGELDLFSGWQPPGAGRLAGVVVVARRTGVVCAVEKPQVAVLPAGAYHLGLGVILGQGNETPVLILPGDLGGFRVAPEARATPAWGGRPQPEAPVPTAAGNQDGLVVTALEFSLRGGSDGLVAAEPVLSGSRGERYLPLDLPVNGARVSFRRITLRERPPVEIHYKVRQPTPERGRPPAVTPPPTGSQTVGFGGTIIGSGSFTTGGNPNPAVPSDGTVYVKQQPIEELTELRRDRLHADATGTSLPLLWRPPRTGLYEVAVSCYSPLLGTLERKKRLHWTEPEAGP